MNNYDDITYQFKLFIAGINPGSIRAIENIRQICDNYLPGNYDLEVIDIYQQRQIAKEMDIIAVPTLIRTYPGPEKWIVGDMTDTLEIISVMEIRTKPKD